MTNSLASTLSDKVHTQQRQILDSIQQQDTAMREITNNLGMPRKMTGGLEARRQQLNSLLTAFAEEFQGGSDAEAIDRWLFPRVCNTWSLHAQNDGLAPGYARFSRVLSGEAATRWEHLNWRVFMAHISCASRVEKAQRSIESFEGYEADYEHLIVVVTVRGESGGFRIQLADGVLGLNCSVYYEAHCRICLVSYTILALVDNPCLVYEFDDDVTLDSGELFDRHLADRKNHMNYHAGQLLTGLPNNRKLWHGCHLGKSSNQKLEGIRYQAPIGSAYAEGGFAYALTSCSQAEQSYAIFTHQAFVGFDTILYEDATVWLLLQMAGIALTPASPFSTGLTSEIHRLQQVLEAGWWTLVDRHNTSVQRLRQHPIHALEAPVAAWAS